MIDPETAYRTYMRTLALKGGAVTKERHGNDLRYYRNVGRLGGVASVAARKAKIAALLQIAPDAEVPIAEPIDTVAGAHANVRRRVHITELLAERKRLGPRQPEVSERQRILDAMAEQHMARILARPPDSHEDEPWDPWD